MDVLHREATGEVHIVLDAEDAAAIRRAASMWSNHYEREIAPMLLGDESDADLLWRSADAADRLADELGRTLPAGDELEGTGVLFDAP